MRTCVLTATLLLVICLLVNAAPPFPRPLGYVSDFADVVEPALEKKITAICTELEHQTGVEIGVATFPDLGGADIDDFTNRLFEMWMPGKKGMDNGILIVDAIAERKIRIEIGYGLEPVIPDAVAGRIRREVMTPYLQKGMHGEAYLAGVAALAAVIAKHEGITLSSLRDVPLQGLDRGGPQEGRGGDRIHPALLIPLAILVVLVLVAAARRRRDYWGGPFIGGPWVGGGPFFGGGFGGFGGGFGGFGGGFSGGGGSSGGY